MTLSELSDAADEIAELESSVEDATKKIADLWEQCREHCSSSGYGHYCKLQVGLSELYQALNKFTSDKSKRPRGKIEFLFNNLIESIGGIHGRARWIQTDERTGAKYPAKIPRDCQRDPVVVRGRRPKEAVGGGDLWQV